MTESNAERALAQELRWLRLPVPDREFLFARPRRWRFDFAWPDRMLAVEVEGGHWVGGHGGTRFALDCAKYNEAALLGWTVLRCTPDQITSGEAIAWIKRALALTNTQGEGKGEGNIGAVASTG